MRSLPASNSERGFTLIEVLIAVGLMAVMFLMMNESMEDLTASRNRILSEADEMHLVEVAFSRLFDDIHSAFLADSSFEGKEHLRVSGFVGDDKTLNFSTMSGLHYVQDKPDTDEHAVGYALKTKKDGVVALMRRSTDSLPPKLDEGGMAFELLPGLKDLEFSYYDSNKASWVGKWDTDSVAFAGRLPQTVKISFVIYGPLKSPDDDEKPELAYEWLIPIALYDQKISF